MNQGMGKRKQVPEDLMGTILGGGASSNDESIPQETDRGTSSPTSAGKNSISWETRPERVGVTFNLSKQVSGELDRLRLELQIEEGIRASNSEIAELALRLAIEDARERDRESELLRRLNKVSADRIEEAVDESRGTPAETTDRMGRTVQRSVEGSGYIVETTYNEQREVVGEELVGNVADLPVEEEYLDSEGRLLSLTRDELGNIFERVTDEESNTLGVRLIRDAG